MLFIAVWSFAFGTYGNYTLAGKCIPSKSHEKDFGVTVSTDLKPSVHIVKVVKQAETVKCA